MVMIAFAKRAWMIPLLGFAALCLLGTEAQAQKITTPSVLGPPTGTPAGTSNTGVLGGTDANPNPVPAPGYNPAVTPAPGVGPAGTGASNPPYTATLAPGYNPSGGANPQATLRPGYTGGGGVLDNYNAANYPFYSNPYSYPPYYNLTTPVEGYLRGVASVTSAQGQYAIQIQRAKLDRQSAIQAAIQTRRMLFDEARYEMMYRPNPEQIRQEQIAMALERARKDPPITEIWSAKALNDLLRHVTTQQTSGKLGPRIDLDAGTLKHINFSPQATRANPGLLKGDGKLQWPLPLQGKEFEEARTKLDRLVENAVQLVKFDKEIDVAALRDMNAYYKQLTETLENSIDDFSPTDSIRAHRYLRQLGNALQALGDPNLSTYFTPGRATNVAELVKMMADKGLVFAPAVSGDEASYRALYNALRAFDAGMNR
jgi:hypothetical protein